MYGYDDSPGSLFQGPILYVLPCAVPSAALKRLRDKVEYTVLPASLLPREFTLPQLQHTFEIVLGRDLDKSAFRTRMLSAGVIEETGDYRPSIRRPAALYRLTESPARTLPGTFRKAD
jgi:8-oxo-dGTP diphosphatase